MSGRLEEEARPALTTVATELTDVEARAVRIRVRGSGFSATSAVFWRDEALPTTLVSATELVAELALTDGFAWTDAGLSVRDRMDPARVSKERKTLPYPAPELLAISPEMLPRAPSCPLRVTLTGRNFTQGSQVDFRGVFFPAVVLSTERAEVELPEEALLMGDGSGGDLVLEASRPQRWRTRGQFLNLGRSPSEIEGVWPTALSTDPKAADHYRRLTVSVRNMRSGLQFLWDGEPLDMAYVIDTQEYLVDLPEGARSKAGTVTLTLKTPGVDGGLSAPFLLHVVDAPVVHSLSPRTWDAAASSMSVRIEGEGLGPDMEVFWDGEPSTATTWFFDGALWVYLPEEARTKPGTHSLQVRHGPGGALSAPVLVQVLDAAPAPVVSGLEPAVVTAGDTAVKLQVFGSGFQPDSVIELDGRALPMQLQSPYTLATTLYAVDLVREGTRTLTVRTPAPGGGTSLPLLLQVDARRPVPYLAELSHHFVTAGSGPMTLYLSGTGLGPWSSVHWNGANLVTWWEPGVEYGLSADVPASLLAQPGVARVQVANGAPGGGLSHPIDLPILAEGVRAPALIPRVVEAGSEELTLTVDGSGSGFTPDTRVKVGDAVRTPVFISSGRLTVKLTAQDLATERSLPIQAVTPQPEGPAVASATQFLSVVPTRTPVLRTVVPGVWSLDGLGPHEAQTLGIQGDYVTRKASLSRGESVDATLDWEGLTHPLRYLDGLGVYGLGSGLGTDFPRHHLSAPGTLQVSISRASEWGGTSLPALVNVVAERPVPLLTQVEPLTLRAGAASQVLRITGEGFHPRSVVSWNGQPLKTQRSGTLLRAWVPGELLAAPGTARVTVETPAPGGGVSLPLPVAVVE